jgi:hypothetical protein
MSMMLVAGLVLSGFFFSVRSDAALASVTCRLRDDARARIFVLDQAAQASPPMWRLSMRDRESGDKWIRLSLPGAMPVIASGSATLSFKNANGGRQVSLDVAPGRSRLEVDVDYGLDVNIEPDLDPAVDRMNTNGPITALDCVVAPR